MDIINDWIKTYLIGPMEKTKAKDSGRGWRDRLRPELEKRRDKNGNPIYVFDPTLEEQNKVEMGPREFHNKMHGWLVSGNNDKVGDGSNLIWKGKTYLEKTEEEGRAKLVHIMGDIDYVENSNFLILYMEKGDSPCGTYGECYGAIRNNIPIYVIQTMARDEYPITLVGWVFGSGGGFFPNQSKLLEFIDEKYDLTIEEEK